MRIVLIYKYLIISIALFYTDTSTHAEPVKSLTEIRRQNVMMQKWDISCGAAALGTILKYQHDLDISEKEIAVSLMQREEYVKNPNIVKMRLGFSLLDLKRYVESIGYLGMGLGSLQLSDLVERAPIMVTVLIHGYNHFVVFRGIRKNRVLLADPAWGNRTMTIDQFMSIWVDNPKIGHIGFQVVSPDQDSIIYGALEPKYHEFVTLH
jgi:uncharacterized protein